MMVVTPPTGAPNSSLCPLHGYLGRTYGARPLQGKAEFEILIENRYRQSKMVVGIVRCQKGINFSINADRLQYCTWWDNHSLNNEFTTNESSDYGHIDLRELCEGDCVGLRISEDGVLEFTVNGESQGIAAENVYTSETDVYAVVDHWSDGGFGTRITRASKINLRTNVTQQ